MESSNEEKTPPPPVSTSNTDVEESTNAPLEDPNNATPTKVEPTLLFRNVCPTDLAKITALEKASYPADEAASRAQIQHRQHHAAAFFRCAVLVNEISPINSTNSADEKDTNDASISFMNDNLDSLNDLGEIVGFITATRCHKFDEESMKTHVPSGKYLAIHSVVVDEKYRKLGIGTRMMKDYINAIESIRANQAGTKLKYPIEKIVLLSKMSNVPFYIRSGFAVMGKSQIQHGQDDWFDCEMVMKEVTETVKKDMSYECWIMDSFATAIKGTGNPAGVVLLTDAGQMDVEGEEQFDPHSEDNQNWMKVVAKEFNLSETAFIWERPNTDGLEYNIRYYTCNGTEVELCGHATLASSQVVFDKLAEAGRRDILITFHASSDVLKCKPAAGRKIHMEFPAKNTVEFETDSEDEKAAKQSIRESLFPNMSEDDFDSTIRYIGVDDGCDDLFVELTADAFFSIPEASDISYVPMMTFDGYSRGIIVCCTVPDELKEAGEKADFFSRFFGPKVGINEDPVTGSAHCVLGPYFAKQLEKNHVVGSQKSERGGTVECTVLEDGVVRIAGSVTKAMSGNLFL